MIWFFWLFSSVKNTAEPDPFRSDLFYDSQIIEQIRIVYAWSRTKRMKKETTITTNKMKIKIITQLRDNTHENGNADYYDDDDWQRWWQPTIEIHKNNGDKCSPLNWMWFTLSRSLSHIRTHMKVPWFFSLVCISLVLLFSKHHMAASGYTPKWMKKQF